MNYYENDGSVSSDGRPVAPNMYGGQYNRPVAPRRNAGAPNMGFVSEASGMDFSPETVDWDEISKRLAQYGIGSRQYGGDVNAGSPYLVGENGPEIIVPQQNGYVEPNTDQTYDEFGAVTKKPVKPVVTTIKHDPVSGEQTMTIKGTPHQLSSSVAGTPTVNLPGVPQAEQMGLTQAKRDAQEGGSLIEAIAAGRGVDGRNLAPVYDAVPRNVENTRAIVAEPVPPVAQRGEVPLNESLGQGEEVVQDVPQQMGQVPLDQSLGQGEEVVQPVVAQAPVQQPAQVAAPRKPQEIIDDYNNKISAALNATKQQESNGNYKAQSNSSSASGAYQFTDGTWAEATRGAGIGTQYKRAKDAPPEIQDKVARYHMERGLARSGNDFSKIPNWWFTGNIEGNISAAGKKANPKTSVAKYNQEWANKFQTALGSSNRPTGVQVASTSPTAGLEALQRQPTAQQKFDETQAFTTNLNGLIEKNDVDGLTKLLQTTKNPAHTRMAVEGLIQAQKTKDALHTGQKVLENAAGQGDLRKAFQGEEGSLAKVALYNLFGFRKAAEAEYEKLGIGDKFVTGVDDKGQGFMIRTSASGRPRVGAYEDGTAIPENELVHFLSQGTAMKGAQHANISQQFYDPSGNVQGNWIIVPNPNGRGAQYKQLGTNRIATPAEAASLTGIRSAAGSKEEQIDKAKKIFEARTAARVDEIKRTTPNLVEQKRLIERATQEEKLRFAESIHEASGYGEKSGALMAEGFTPAPYTSSTSGGGTVGGKTVGGQTGAGQGAGQTTGQAVTGQTGAAQSGTQVTALISPALAKQRLATTEKEENHYVSNVVPAEIENGKVGSETANARRAQMDVILRNPEIIGSMVGVNGSRTSTLLRNIAIGAYGKGNDLNIERFRQDLNALGLSEKANAALGEYLQYNAKINALNLKATTGGNNVSNAEQRINQNANLNNIGEYTPWEAVTGISRTAFQGDLAKAKADFMNSHPEIRSQRQLETEWDKIESKLLKQYQGIYQARIEYVQRQTNMTKEELNRIKSLKERITSGKGVFGGGKTSDSEKTTGIDKAYTEASLHSARVYPMLRYDSDNNTWVYDSKQAKQAAMNGVLKGK